MKTISIHELHENTGEWIRAAVVHEQIVITESGQPIAVISPHLPLPESVTPTMKDKFEKRVLLPSFAKLMGKLSGGTDSTTIIAEDRDRGASW